MNKALSIIFFVVLMFPGISNAQQSQKLRIGIFDSRAIAIVYGRSDVFRNQIKSMRAELQAAKENRDSVKIKILNQKGRLQQRIMHDRGFGTGSVTSILEIVKDSIPQIARNFILSAIVSKWELLAPGNEIETVDITIPLAKLFNPDEKTLDMIKEINKSKPIENAFFIED
jgi:hypothetical protein